MCASVNASVCVCVCLLVIVKLSIITIKLPNKIKVIKSQDVPHCITSKSTWLTKISGTLHLAPVPAHHFWLFTA